VGLQTRETYGKDNLRYTFLAVPEVTVITIKDVNLKGFLFGKILWKFFRAGRKIHALINDTFLYFTGFVAEVIFLSSHGLNEKAILSSPPISRNSPICFKFYYMLKKTASTSNFYVDIENG